MNNCQHSEISLTSSVFRKMFIAAVVFLFLIVFPNKAEAKTGYNYSYLSLLYGFHTVANQSPFQRIDILLSQCRKTRSRGRGPFHYYGVGANYSFNNDFEEWGVLMNVRPFRAFFAINREHTIIPVVYTQLGIKNSKEFCGQNDFNARIGLGLEGFFLARGNGAIRSSMQVGYIFSDAYLPNQSGFTFELKIGYGIHGFRRQKRALMFKGVDIKKGFLILQEAFPIIGKSYLSSSNPM